MDIETILSLAAIFISFVTALGVYRQTRVLNVTTKAQLFTSIVDQIHQNTKTQELMGYIIRDELESAIDHEDGKTKIHHSKTKIELTDDIDRLLGRFQLLGHLHSMGALSSRNLQTLHFEIIITGRNKAIQEYFKYLNTVFIEQSGVLHHHFEYFKKLYLKQEDSVEKINDFRQCSFNEWAAITCVCRYEEKCTE